MGLLTIKTMAELTGVSTHTLRAWERRYNALSPLRSPSGQRTYNLKDLEKLRVLKKLTEAGFSIGQIAGLPAEKLNELLQEKGIAEHIPEQITSFQGENEKKVLEDILHAVHHYQLADLNYHLSRARIITGSRDFIMKMVAPLLCEVGRLVSDKKMSISQEHAFSAVLRNQLGNIIQNSPSTHSPHKACFAIATPEGDFHEFGILLSQIILNHHNINSYYLGANLPSLPLAETVEALKISHLLIGHTAHFGSLNFSFDRYLVELLNSLPRNVEVWVGGRGTSDLKIDQLPRPVVHINSLELFDDKVKDMQ